MKPDIDLKHMVFYVAWYDVARQYKVSFMLPSLMFDNIKTVGFTLSDVVGRIKHHLSGKSDLHLFQGCVIHP
jgi:hypothetical protein